MTDPYLAGIDEPYFEWVRPASSDCSTCSCCTLALCQQATQRGLLCLHLVGHGPSVLDVSDCPCTAPGPIPPASSEAS